MNYFWSFYSLCFILTPWLASAQTEPKPPSSISELMNLSIESLMDIEVTSVTKSPQKLSESATAIYVITQEDIRRSGMNSIPELLRMVPGLNVAQFDGNKWAISSRGFNDLFANKLLEDIERIEVIRGPGGTLWGANAVNGVINIITKRTHDTVGGC